MKNYLKLGIAALAAAMLVGCTLSMDEWVETEEQKGYDEVETVANDFYSMSYEYKETTRSLTEEIQKYVAMVEDDSVLYFMENTPSEWIPKEGGQVVANCGEKFPMGLMGRVLSVENSNGFIKVVTTEASIEDCFEDFDFELDADLFTNPAEQEEVLDDEEQADTAQAPRLRFNRAGKNGKKEMVIRDWAMFNATEKGGHRPTRAKSLEEIYGQDIDNRDEETTDLLLCRVTPTDAVGKAIASATKVNTIDIKVYYTTKTTIHKVVKLKTKREYTATTTTTGYKLSALVGVDLVKAKTDDAKSAAELKLSTMLKNKDKFPKFSKKLDAVWMGEDDMELVVEIPLGSCPFGVVIRLMPVFDVNFGIYGDVECIFWTSKSRTTTDVVNGKKVTDKNEKLTVPSNQFEFNAFGQFHVGGGGELFIGVGKKLGKKAVGIGGFLQLTADLYINISPVTIGDYQIGSPNDAMTLSGNGRVGGKILTGGIFGDIEFLTKEFKWWDGYTWSYDPKVEWDKSFPTLEETDNEGNKYTRQTMGYKFTSLGMNASSLFTRTHKPFLNVYESENQDLDKPTKTIYAKSFTSKSKLATNKTYEFTYDNHSGEEIFIVPGIEGTNKSMQKLYPAFKTSAQPTLKPAIEYDILYDDDAKDYEHIFQTTEVRKFDRIGYDQAGAYAYTVYDYGFALPFIVHNAGAMSDFWDDWGIMTKVSIVGIDSKTRYKSLKNKNIQSGKNVMVTTFTCWSMANTEPAIDVQSYFYYVLKGEKTKRLINSYDEREFSYQTYKTRSKDKGDILLRSTYRLDNNGGYWEPDKSYKKLSNNMNIE
ncbi:MAG: hypothetical protein IJ637_01935 [Prevotella sp.]|nr:hypothetical protein [Prevotella sp.]